MTWNDTWNDIVDGGSSRWKVEDPKFKRIALNHITEQLKEGEKTHIFCPLAGDDPFVHLAWSEGHSVSTIDIVPVAVSEMRKQFDGEWTKEEKDGIVVWKHESNRATLYEGDALKSISELKNSVGAIYDKDSFGALDLNMRNEFCQRIAEYSKNDAILYIEVKLKSKDSPGRNFGPPYSVNSDDLMEPTNYGSAFNYVKNLGEVYELHMPQMKQTGHILKRKPRETTSSAL